MGKTNDYGGQGLNRGNSMHFSKPMPEGVVYNDNAGKWLVRILKKGRVCSMGGFKEKEDAIKYYTQLIKN